MHKLYTQIAPKLIWSYRCDFRTRHIAYSRIDYVGDKQLITGKFLYGQFKHFDSLYTCKIIKTSYGYAILFEVELNG